MPHRQAQQAVRLLLALASLMSLACASEYHGQVTFGGLPVPGATISATQGTKKQYTPSDPNGQYSFADLPDGAWSIDVEMQCFTPVHADITVGRDTPAGKWEL